MQRISIRIVIVERGQQRHGLEAAWRHMPSTDSLIWVVLLASCQTWNDNLRSAFVVRTEAATYRELWLMHSGLHSQPVPVTQPVTAELGGRASYV